MPNLTTELTEIGTGLGTLPYATWQAAVLNRPAALVEVQDAVWRRLEAAIDEPRHAEVVERSWRNGRALLEAQDGLRGRPPNRVEWKGNHRPPGYERLPQISASTTAQSARWSATSRPPATRCRPRIGSGSRWQRPDAGRIP